MGTLEARWIVETRESEERFRTLLRRSLSLRGFALGGAKVYDFSAQGHGGRCFLRIAYVERGFAVDVKAKEGLLRTPREALEQVRAALASAARNGAQASVAGETRSFGFSFELRE